VDGIAQAHPEQRGGIGSPAILEGSSPAVLKPRHSLYFISGPVDYAMIGGLSIVTYILLRLLYTDVRTNEVIMLGIQLAWIVNWPHFSATNYRLYHSVDNIRQYPITALVIPWVVLAGTIGSMASPAIVAPYFVKLFMIWSPYHFSGQTVGITMIYARRAGFMVGKLERLALSGFVFGTYLTTLARAEVDIKGSEYYGLQIPGLGIPPVVPVVFEVAMYLFGLLFAGLAVRWCVQNKRVLPPIVLLPAVAQYIWFLPGASYYSFVEFVPLFHSLQYMLIAWSMQMKEKMDQRKIQPSAGYVVSESTRWGVLNIIGGGMLFKGIPVLLAMGGTNEALATGIIAAAVQIHHFFVDGVIWKLKRTTVSSPLMMNIADLVTPPAQAQPVAGQKA
jgi:hypothetical protein